MRVKAGVELDGVQWPLWLAAGIADALKQGMGYGEATITSGRDGGDAWGPARVASSAHPGGGAIDLRTRDMDPHAAQQWAQQLQFAIAPYGFRVLLEADHIHIEIGRGVTV